jgi:hypothetical protein
MAEDGEIRLLAYKIWLQEGRPDGKDVEHYLRAKAILEEQEANRVLELAAPVPISELPAVARYAELAPPATLTALPKEGAKPVTRGRRKKKAK